MPTLTADKVLNHTIYAKGLVKGYDGALKNVTHTFNNGQMIGNVYSWIINPDGQLYWMVYVAPNDYANQNPTYVEQNANISLPSLPDIMAQIQQENEQRKLNSMGTVNYFLDKYGKIIVIAVGVAIVLPAIAKASNTKKINGMTTNDKQLLTVAGSVIALYFLAKKKRSGSVIVDPLDEGSYGTDAIQQTNTTVQQPATLNNSGSGRLLSVGIFPVIYDTGTINGKRGDIGSIKSF